MPQVFIPFNKMDFRQGGSPGEDLWLVTDAIKKENGYFVFNGWQKTHSAISWGETDKQLWGIGSFYDNTYSANISKTYVGGENNIYTFDGGVVAAVGRPSVAPGPAGFNYNTNTGLTPKGWFFAQFGPYMYAVNGVDNIQIAEPGSATPLNTYFNDLGTAPSVLPTNGANPTARYIMAHKNHVVIAHVTLAAAYGALAAAAYPYTWPNLVWWSGLDNGSGFGDSTVSPNIDGTGWQIIFDGTGVITGMIGGYDAAFIFKTGSIHRMDGPPFQINCISNSLGCIQPRSIVRLGDRVYFWSTRGPAYIDTTNNSIGFMDDGSINDVMVRIGSSDRLTTSYIGTGPTTMGITPAEVSKRSAISGAVDPENQLVIWRMVTEVSQWDRGAPFYFTIFLAYNERTDSYSILQSGPDSELNSGDTDKASLLISSPVPTTGGDFARVKRIFPESATNTLSQYEVVGEYGTRDGYFRLPFIPFTDKPGVETKVERIRIRYRNGGYIFSPAYATPAIQFGYSILTTSQPSTYPFVTTSQAPPAQTSADGWIVVSNSVFGSAHSIEVSITCVDTVDGQAVKDKIGYIEGIDVIYTTRGGRSA